MLKPFWIALKTTRLRSRTALQLDGFAARAVRGKSISYIYIYHLYIYIVPLPNACCAWHSKPTQLIIIHTYIYIYTNCCPTGFPILVHGLLFLSLFTTTRRNATFCQPANEIERAVRKTSMASRAYRYTSENFQSGISCKA